MSKSSPSAGFSLVETMVVLAVVAILIAIAAPSFGALIRHQRLKVATADLALAIAMTRAQALARGSLVQLVPADPLGQDWRSGWIVFVDRDGDQQLSAGDELIFRHAPLAGDISFAYDFTAHTGPDYIAYNGAGRSCSAANSAAAQFGTLSLFLGGQTRRIKINMLGRMRICDPASEGATCSGAADSG